MSRWKSIQNTFTNLFLPNRFFMLSGAIVLLFVLSFLVSFLLPIALTALALFFIVVLFDIFSLFNPNVYIDCQRLLPKVFSLGDENPVRLQLHNQSNLDVDLTIIDEIPIQFQKRDFSLDFRLSANEEQTLNYPLQPLERGEYHFGNVNLFISSSLGLVQRRIQQKEAMSIPVYPSILQMKKYELLSLNKISTQQGIKKIRRLGHSYEFEQIKNYEQGDDYRSINWKASSRRAQLMVNQYDDERSQQVYTIIDKSRNMRMPFAGLSLMDYAINSSLVIANVVLQKHDKAGLLTFSDKIGTTLKADRKSNQLNKILAALYREKERDLEANYEILYHSARKIIKGRSLIMLYTNFESQFALRNVLPILRRINNLHLLVVIFFKNTEIEDFINKECETTEEIYQQTIARKYLHEKEQMVQILKQYGIQAVLSRPENLSINSINKYLELKSRGLI